MPTYQYACTACDHRFDAVQAFSDNALTTCPECEGRLRKVFSSVGIVFKGSGFYRTDSRAGAVNGSESGKSESKSESGKSESGSSDSGKSESSTSGKSDSGSSGSGKSDSGSSSSGSSPGSSSSGSGSSGSSTPAKSAAST